MKRKLLSILLALAMALSLLPTAALADGTQPEAETDPKNFGDWKNAYFTVNEMRYQSSSDETKAKLVPISDTVKYSGEVEVPGTVEYDGKTYTVTEIQGGVGTGGPFYGSTELTSVKLPNSITSIPSYVFSGCTGLTSVELGNNVTSIAREAFSGCTALTTLNLPGTLTSIGASAFKNCKALTTLTIPDSVTYIGGAAFEGLGATSLKIPASVTAGKDAGLFGYGGTVTFAEGSKFQLDDGVLYYDNTLLIAFDWDMTEYTVLDGTTAIGDKAFAYSGISNEGHSADNVQINSVACAELTKITLPASLKTIGKMAFGNNTTGMATCEKLATVTFTGGTPSLESIGDYAFAQTALSSIDLPDTLTTISELAFAGTKLESVVIPKGVTEIPDNAFSGMTALKTVVLCGDVTSVGKSAFSSWKNNTDGCTLVMTSESAPQFDEAGAFGTTTVTVEEDFEDIEITKPASPKNLTVLVPSTAESAYEIALNNFTGIKINTFGIDMADVAVTTTGDANTKTFTADVPTGCTLAVTSANHSVATAEVTDGNTITVTGVNAGTTTITATIKLGNPACTLMEKAINVTVLNGADACGVVNSAVGGSAEYTVSADGTLSISGGTFSVDPSNYIGKDTKIVKRTGNNTDESPYAYTVLAKSSLANSVSNDLTDGVWLGSLAGVTLPAYHYVRDNSDGTYTIYYSKPSSGSSSSGSSSTTKTETTTSKDGSTTKTETKSDGTKVETTTAKDGTKTVVESKTTTAANGTKTETTTETVTAKDGSKTEVKTETVTAKDGSKVKTTTEKTTATDGTKTESETKVETKTDGSRVETAVKTETKTDGSKSETTSEVKTAADGTTTSTETTKATDAAGSTGTTTTETNAAGETTQKAEAKVSEKAVEAAQKENKAVTVPVEVKATTKTVSAPVVNIAVSVKSDNSSSKAEVKVEVPVTNVGTGTVAVLVKADGTEEIIKTTVPTEGGVQIKVSGDVTIKVVDNSKNFADTADHWSKNEVNFVASREIFNGVGNNDFGVSEPMTRGMVNTVLARLSGENTDGGTNWYDKGNEWAVANGVSDGANPTANVTREQLATMLYRYVGSPEVTGTLTFTDAENVSDYAQSAMLWAVQNGILNGVGDNRIAPNNSAERAQVAAMLARYIKLVG